MAPMLKCNKCGQSPDSVSSRKWDGMFVDILCLACFHAWMEERGYKLPPNQPLPTVTNGIPGIAKVKVGQMDGNGSNSPKDPMTAGQRAEAKKPLVIDDVPRCTTCHGEKDAGGWCDCTRSAIGKPPLSTATKSFNNTYTIEVQSPLLRPGLKISTEVSERYVVETVKKIMNMIREINK